MNIGQQEDYPLENNETPSKRDLRETITFYNSLFVKRSGEIQPPEFKLVEYRRYLAKISKIDSDIKQQYQRIMEKADYVIPGFNRMRTDDQPERTVSVLLDALGEAPMQAPLADEHFNPGR